jgi:hypothetical protein
MPQELPWSCSRTFAVLEGRFTIDDNGVIAFGSLHSPPFTAGQIVHNLTNPVRFDAKPV